MVEILKDNAGDRRPGEVYAAMDMGWGQLQSARSPRPTESEWDSSPSACSH